MKQRLLLVMLLVIGLLSAIPTQAQEETTLTVITHDSFSISEEVLQAFEQETGITVEILLSGDAGTMVNQSILSADDPLGDVMFGVDNTFLGRALAADLFEAYESPALAAVPEEFIVDTEFRVTPIDYGDVCLNYDIAYFEENDLAVPQTLEDLTSEAYRGLLVVENPAVSSPGLAFLLATIDQFGEEGYLEYWEALVENEVLVVDDWTTAYFTEFSLAGGDYPLVVSYASSPPVEVVFADPPVETAPTASIVADGMCFRQIEFAGILKGSDQVAAAQQFIDFMLSQPFQEDIPLQMYVFPVLPDAALPEVFTQYATVPENPVLMDYTAIDENRDTWIEAWTETVLR